MLKLFIETNFWNWLSFGTGAFCIGLYSATVIILNTNTISGLLQPELEYEYYLIIQSAKAWVVILVLPLVVLVPDMSLLFIQKVFYPTPTDAVMQIQ